MTTLQANKRIALNDILFLTDFSEPSAAAVPFATSISRAYASTVHALHVLVPSPYTYMTPEAAPILWMTTRTAPERRCNAWRPSSALSPANS
jgi:hypothetical protein